MWIIKLSYLVSGFIPKKLPLYIVLARVFFSSKLLLKIEATVSQSANAYCILQNVFVAAKPVESLLC